MLIRVFLLTLLFPAFVLIAPMPGSARNKLTKKDAAHGISIETWRSDTKLVLTRSKNTVLIDITSPFGIDRGIIHRVGEKWPEKIRIRLHLWGLESFRAGNGKVDLKWSVSNKADRHTRMSLRKGAGRTTLTEDSTYWTNVRFEDGKNGKVPPVFEVLLPTKLFDRNPGKLKIQWVDFFRI